MKTLVSTIAVLALFTADVKAQDVPPEPAEKPDEPAEVVDQPDTTGETTDKASDAERITALAKEFKVPEKSVSDMRNSKMGWGEINTALSLSKAISEKAPADKPITIDAALVQVLADRKSGMGWGNIAQKYGFKLGDIVRSDKARKPEVTGEKVDKPEKVEKPAKPEKIDKPVKSDDTGTPEKVGKPDKTEKGRPDKI